MSPAPELLARVPLFADLNASELEDLSTYLRRRRYGRGEAVFREGDSGESLFVIEEGLVKIAISSPEGNEVILDLLEASTFFGELALLDGQPRSADAVAIEPSVLLSLGRTDFLRYLAAKPGAAATMLATMSHRLRRTTNQLRNVAFLDVPARLAQVLLKLSGAGDGSEVPASEPFRLTQSQIASLVGTTRESVNKWLGFYERHGLIRREGGHVAVLEPKQLRKYAS